jgi:signal transduction histidine kinase
MTRKTDDFLAVMSHELRNPLASIVATVDAVRLRGGHANDAEMGTIGRQARHMNRLVDDLLDASRALRDTVPPLRVLIEVGHILADAIELTGPAMTERGHLLTVDIAGRGLVVNVDVERMVQVFGNILSNAAKYTSQKGRINVRASATADQVTVCVEDSGDGIAPELLDQIFEPLVQGDQGLDRKRGGLGIGLAVVRKLVWSHDGEVFAASPGPGRGSTITVRLPLAALALASNESTLSPTKERRRILLVDDNHDFVESLQSALEALGHETFAAFDGRMASRRPSRSSRTSSFSTSGYRI